MPQVNRVRGNVGSGARRIVYPWTPEEDALLRQAYAANGGGEPSAVKRLPGRSLEGIRSRAVKLKLTRMRWWTAEDLERLKSMWGLEPVEEIARVLRRNRNAVVWRANQLGLQIGIPDGWESMSSASERTGYPLPCLRTILRWSEVRIVKQFTRYTKGKIPKCIVEISEVDYAVHEWHETETVAEAAERIGWSRLRMLLAMERAGCAPPRRTQSGKTRRRSHSRVLSSDVDKAVAAEARHCLESWSLVEIRAEMHIASQTIVKWLREDGYQRLTRYQRVPHETLCALITKRMGHVEAVRVSPRQRRALQRLPLPAQVVHAEKRRGLLWRTLEGKGWVVWDGDTLRRTPAGDQVAAWSHVPRKYRAEILAKLAERTKQIEGAPVAPANTNSAEEAAA